MNFSDMAKAIENLKNQQQEGESPAQTVLRVLGGQLTDQQKEELAKIGPKEEEAPKKTLYRFKTYDEMNGALAMRYGVNWQGLINPQGTLVHAFGITPGDERSQAEMGRVFQASNDQVGAVHVGGHQISFTREMILPA